MRGRLLLHVRRRLLLVTLPRRLFAEFLGTALLVAIVVGSGIAAQRLTTDVGVQLLVNSLATAAGLAVLIVVLLPVSRAHFNPAVSLADWWLGRRRGHGLSLRHVAAYSVAQVGGAVAGAVLADALFSQAVAWSQHARSGWALLLSEAVATAGLVLVIFGLALTDRSRYTPVAVGAWIGAAYWWTSSTSFANPAATVGRAFTDTFAGIAPASVLPFIGAQLAGVGLGLAVIHALLPHREDAVMGPRVLFACRANAGRSVAARLLAEQYGAGRIAAFSAGSEPGSEVHPEITAVLAERGLDTSGEQPKPFDPTASYDVVITMGCGDTCPVYLGARYEDWPLDDPRGQSLETVRRIVDDIDARVRSLVGRLAPA